MINKYFEPSTAILAAMAWILITVNCTEVVPPTDTAPTVAYSSSSYSFVANAAIADITPTINGTPLTNCVSNPTLPAGISIDATTCAISGTPTTVQSTISYAITASNSYSTGSAVISIEVTAAGVAPTVSYTGSPFTFTQDSAITTITPTLGGNTPTSCTSSPTLPAGLSINGTSCEVSGTPTVTQSATSYTVTATNAYGDGTADISITIDAAGVAPTVSYTDSPFTFTQDSAITTITPTLGGNTPTSCTSSPTLPAGLSLNATSCAISGTPTATQSATSYTVTATNAYGDGTAGISISIDAAEVAPTVSYTGSPFTFTLDSAITTITPTLGGNTPTSCTSSPTLPAGLSINATSCAISGTVTATQTATSYTITASNAYGNGTANISIEVIPLAGSQYILTAGGVSFNMRFVHAKSFKTGIDDSGSSSISTAYQIAETEVTYELWSTVYTWATANGYTFANTGTMGDGSGDTNQHPVTTINWRDAMVWTNALTEYYNAQNGTSYAVVYTSDTGYTTPIRSSVDGSYSASTNMTAGSFDNPYVNPNAKGFRLPTSDEWELAARYIDDANSDGDIMDIGEYYPGSYISGDTSNPYNTSTILGDYGWYSGNSGSSTHPVATKTANALGLYDMSGNVWEWANEWLPNWVGTNRVFRGGGYGLEAYDMQVARLNWYYPHWENYGVGFRPSRTP